jgi:hypothetical protein
LALEEKNKELIKSFIDEVFNNHDVVAIDNYIAANLTDGAGKHQNHSKSH